MRNFSNYLFRLQQSYATFRSVMQATWRMAVDECKSLRRANYSKQLKCRPFASIQHHDLNIPKLNANSSPKWTFRKRSALEIKSIRCYDDEDDEGDDYNDDDDEFAMMLRNERANNSICGYDSIQTWIGLEFLKVIKLILVTCRRWRSNDEGRCRWGLKSAEIKPFQWNMLLDYLTFSWWQCKPAVSWISFFYSASGMTSVSERDEWQEY